MAGTIRAQPYHHGYSEAQGKSKIPQVLVAGATSRHMNRSRRSRRNLRNSSSHKTAIHQLGPVPALIDGSLDFEFIRLWNLQKWGSQPSLSGSLDFEFIRLWNLQKWGHSSCWHLWNMDGKTMPVVCWNRGETVWKWWKGERLGWVGVLGCYLCDYILKCL